MTTRDQRIIQRIRELFATPEDNIPLHAPLFTGNERRYVLDVIESTFVSSVGRQPMFAHCTSGPLLNSEELERRLVSIPNSVRGL